MFVCTGSGTIAISVLTLGLGLERGMPQRFCTLSPHSDWRSSGAPGRIPVSLFCALSSVTEKEGCTSEAGSAGSFAGAQYSHDAAHGPSPVLLLPVAGAAAVAWVAAGSCGVDSGPVVRKRVAASTMAPTEPKVFFTVMSLSGFGFDAGP